MLVFRYTISSTTSIVFMVLFMGVFTVLSGAAFVPVSNAVFKLGLPVVALLGYIAIFAGGALEILIGELLLKAQ